MCSIVLSIAFQPIKLYIENFYVRQTKISCAKPWANKFLFLFPANVMLLLLRNPENRGFVISENKRENDANEGITRTNSLLHTNKERITTETRSSTIVHAFFVCFYHMISLLSLSFNCIGCLFIIIIPSNSCVDLSTLNHAVHVQFSSHSMH